MDFFYSFFRTLASIISVYSTLCFIRIILTWIPSLQYSKITQFFATICDPYLNLFSRIPLRFYNLDFTPILAFVVLSGISQILLTIGALKRISVGVILGIVVQLAWSVVSSLLTFLIIILIVRAIFLLINKNSGSGVWGPFDSFVYAITYPMVKVFTKNKYISTNAMTVIALCIALVFNGLGGFLIRLLTGLLLSIPF